MINVPVDTVEKPITVVDYCAALQACATVAEVGQFGEQCPLEIRQDERFAKAVSAQLAAIHHSRAVA